MSRTVLPAKLGSWWSGSDSSERPLVRTPWPRSMEWNQAMASAWACNSSGVTTMSEVTERRHRLAASSHPGARRGDHRRGVPARHQPGDAVLDDEGEVGNEAGAHHGRQLPQRQSRPAREVEGRRQVDDVEETVDRPHDLGHLRDVGPVLQRDPDQHEHEQAYADDVGHDAVAAQGGLYANHRRRHVLGPPADSWARRSL